MANYELIRKKVKLSSRARRKSVLLFKIRQTLFKGKSVSVFQVYKMGEVFKAKEIIVLFDEALKQLKDEGYTLTKEGTKWQVEPLS